MKWLKIITCVVFFALLAGCAQLRTSMVATQNMNPDINGQPSPIVVKIYQLTASDTFNQSSFFALFDSPQTALGNQLIMVKEVVLAPAETKHVWVSLNPQTRYVGIVAGYRQLGHTVWRQVIPIPLNSTEYFGFGMDVSLSASGVTVNEGTL